MVIDNLNVQGVVDPRDGHYTKIGNVRQHSYDRMSDFMSRHKRYLFHYNVKLQYLACAFFKDSFARVKEFEFIFSSIYF